jgi:DNA repair protein RadC
MHTQIEKTVRYSRYSLKQAVWHLRDVPDLPLGFQRTMKIIHPEDAARMLSFLFKDLPQEHLVVVMLNRRNCVQAIDVATIGTMDSSLAHPREVFRSAIACLASSIILMHNHPSGTLEPSAEDINLTLEIERCGRILGIPLMDHIIICGENFVSMAELGHVS